MSDAPRLRNIADLKPAPKQTAQSAASLAERPQGEPWPEAEPQPVKEAASDSFLERWKRLPLKERLRLPLLAAIPLLVAAVALSLYLAGGRYVSTDNAYVGADKVMVAPEVTGPIVKVLVSEGARVADGEVLFEVDPEPYRIALESANARLDAARVQLAALKQSYQKALSDIEMATRAAGLRSKELERKLALAERKYASEADVDAAQLNTAITTGYVGSLRQQARSVLAQLDNDADLPLERFPAYREAKAAVDGAQRNLRLTKVTAPISGIAAQTSLVVTGRHVTTGAPALAIVSEEHVWVDANPKETDIAHLKPGDAVEIDVDAYRGHRFYGKVLAIGAGTGAEFAVLPPQNSSGNWVKVVQRVPVRIRIERREGDPVLRAGMSAHVTIDTGYSRSIFDLF